MIGSLPTSRAQSPALARQLVMLGVALVALSLAVGLFAMTVFNRAHNEQMYVAAAYLLTQSKQLYSDFAFVQMPYSVLAYALVYTVTGGGFYLLKAKVVNWLWMMLAAGLLVGRARKSSQDTLLTLFLLVLYFANYYLLRATIEASNYAMPLALSLLASVLWLRGAEGRMNYPLASLLAGTALGGALGAKLYYATLALPLAVTALLYPRHLPTSKRLFQGILPMAAGGLIALLPVGYYALSDWDRFLFNNVGYHTLNTQWRLQNGFTDLTWAYKWETARDLIGNPNYLVLELWLAVTLLLGWSRFKNKLHERSLPTPGVWLAGTTALVAIFTAFTPSPLFAQYFAMPVPFLLLWMAELYGALAQRERWVLLRLGAICAVVGVLAVLPRHTEAVTRLLQADEPWSGVAAVEEARRISNMLNLAEIAHAAQANTGARAVTFGTRDPGEQASSLPLATLAPVLALEAGIPFYPELATGSFLLRVGDLLTPEQREHYVATSPSSLAALLDDNPPGAILIGDEGDVETPLRQYAETHGYERADFALRSGELWLLPVLE